MPTRELTIELDDGTEITVSASARVRCDKNWGAVDGYGGIEACEVDQEEWDENDLPKDLTAAQLVEAKDKLDYAVINYDWVSAAEKDGRDRE